MGEPGEVEADVIEAPIDEAADGDEVVDEIAALQAKADSYLDDLRRVAADFDNYRKRTQRELGQVIERASEGVVKSLLPVLDSLDAALSVETTTETEEKLKAGVRGTRDQLLDILIKQGLEPIETFDQVFDPSLHEAVLSSGEGDGGLLVSDEFRRGYLFKGKVLRPSLVGVRPGETSV
jgi:molecular chaperone GrpE